MAFGLFCLRRQTQLYLEVFHNFTFVELADPHVTSSSFVSVQQSFEPFRIPVRSTCFSIGGSDEMAAATMKSILPSGSFGFKWCAARSQAEQFRRRSSPARAEPGTAGRRERRRCPGRGGDR